MKFVIGVASEWYCRDYDMKQYEMLKASNEFWDKDALESFEEELRRIKTTTNKYTDIPLEIKEVNYLIKYTDGRIEKYPHLRYVATINNLEKLIELSEKCNIIIDNDTYDLPYIQFYDTCIE